MYKQSRSFTLLILSLALVGVTTPICAQTKKQEAKPSRGVVEEKRDQQIIFADGAVRAKKESSSRQKAVNIEIRNVTKNDALAKKSPDGKSRPVPVTFEWLCGQTGSAKLVELEAVLETVNTDGTKTRVSKKIADWTVNKWVDERIDLPMPEGVFARDFKLTLKGKCRPNSGAALVDISEVKTGGFPLPANLVDRKK